MLIGIGLLPLAGRDNPDKRVCGGLAVGITDVAIEDAGRAGNASNTSGECDEQRERTHLHPER